MASMFVYTRGDDVIDNTMTIDELYAYQETGKLPKRLQRKTRMQVISDVADQDPALAMADAVFFHKHQTADVQKRNKYGAVKTEIDGITFDSKREAARYVELKEWERAGLIANLECHPRYTFEHNGVKITSYRPDFRYELPSGDTVVEDVKGGTATRTRDYVIRKKLMKAFFGIDVIEVM